MSLHLQGWDPRGKGQRIPSLESLSEKGCPALTVTVYLATAPGRCVHEVILVVFPYSVVMGMNWDSAVEEPECSQLSL